MVSNLEGLPYPLAIRLSIGLVSGNRPVVDHVWAIAAFRSAAGPQSDSGLEVDSIQAWSYLWLQSYIGHYSLEQWMREAERREGAGTGGDSFT